MLGFGSESDWLLKQGLRLKGKPAVKKCVIVTPSSLAQNWAAEFKKWLGVERLQVMVLTAGPEAKAQVRLACRDCHRFFPPHRFCCYIHFHPCSCTA